jgi:hypothetical protein
MISCLLEGFEFTQTAIILIVFEKQSSNLHIFGFLNSLNLIDLAVDVRSRLELLFSFGKLQFNCIKVKRTGRVQYQLQGK